MRRWTRVLACAALAAATSSAGARVGGNSADGVYRFPSDDVPNLVALRSAIQSPLARAIVVKPGRYDIGNQSLFVAARDNLLICGATGNPADVVFTSSIVPAVSIQKARHITLRGLTLESTTPFGWPLDLSAAPSADQESYVDDVVVDRCILKGYVGINATVRTKNLTVTRSRIVVTGSESDVTPKQGLAGVLWQDGPGLYIGRSRFTTETGVPAVAAVLVRGAQSGASEGDRARGLFMVGNTVTGEFVYGFSLADVVDARVRGNTFRFPSNTTTAPVLDIAPGSGRIGVVVLRANASALTEDFEIDGNVVRRGFYGAYLLNASQGAVRRNDFRGCGAAAPDVVFSDRGGALRMNVQGGACRVAVTGNDFRGLRTPRTDPAVVILPPEYDPLECFPSDRANRVDRGRPLYVVQTQ